MSCFISVSNLYRQTFNISLGIIELNVVNDTCATSSSGAFTVECRVLKYDHAERKTVPLLSVERIFGNSRCRVIPFGHGMRDGYRNWSSVAGDHLSDRQ
jgi:hypothetical protein